MSIRVLLVDDQELIRKGFRMVLDASNGIEVVGEADDGDTAIELLEHVEADVVLMDVRMPRMSDVEATRRLRAAGDLPRVLILTTFDLDEYAYDALRAGASGFLLKDTPVGDLTAAIAHVHSGDAVVAPSTTRRLLDTFAGAPGAGSPPRAPHESVAVQRRYDDLTPREHDVLRLVARGMSNAEIARELVLQQGTVKVHVGRILTKLDLRDRVQAVVLAYESGLVEPGDR